MFDEDFMTPEDHYARLVTRLEPETLALYNQTQHGRVETAYRNRNFVVYRMDGRAPREIDRILINDFRCDDERGATTELMSLVTKKIITVGYAPVQVFDHPVFVSIPLSAKVRWSAMPSAPDKGSLAFPLYIRTMSRHHMRERGIVYFETGPVFGKEFHDVLTA